MKRCGEAPSGMILSSMAYNRRCRKTTFGVSNRIGFLRQLKDSGVSPAPPYPPQYHGPSGEGQEFALGISIAGSAGNDYILGPVSTFGRLDALKRLPNSLQASCVESGKQVQVISPTSHDAKAEVLPKIGFKHFLMTQRDTKSPTPRVLMKPLESNDPKRSFKDKYKDTKASILPMPDSHFNCSEEYRYGRTFVDEEGLKAKNMYRLKIKNYISDKNASNSKIFA
jgi:hypothetical protein